MALTLEILIGMADGGHLAFVEEEHKDVVRLSHSLEHESVLKQLPLSQLLLQHLLEDALPRAVPHLEHVCALVVLAQVFVEQLDLEH